MDEQIETLQRLLSPCRRHKLHRYELFNDRCMRCGISIDGLEGNTSDYDFCKPKESVGHQSAKLQKSPCGEKYWWEDDDGQTD